VLEGSADIPCGDVFALAKTGRKNENFLQNSRAASRRHPCE
jgi:hypothetical protein